MTPVVKPKLGAEAELTRILERNRHRLDAACLDLALTSPYKRLKRFEAEREENWPERMA